MRSRLPRRLLLGAALGSVVAGALTLAGLRLSQRNLQSSVMAYQMRTLDHTACVAAPQDWGFQSGGISMFAYSRAGHSSNPAAPRLEDALLERASLEDEVAISRSAELMIAVVPRAPDGPCALIRTTSRNTDPIIGRRFLGVLGGAVGIGMALSGLGTFWLVLLPLRRRIETVADAAQHVGGDSFAPPARGDTDALGHIAEVLARSHDRIVESREALVSRNRALERHLAGIAHDLRTPLSSMHLALEALADQSDGGVQREARRALADAVYLSSLVDNLHQATRLRQEVDVTAGRVELTDLVRRIEQRFAIVGRHAQIEVAASTPEEEIWIACTPAFAERAVSNLVQNAVEHNEGESGHVAITLESLAGLGFALTVADDGPGLPDEARASLHDESFLGDGARPRGPGMGMLITSEVARRAGWSLSYDALEPKGLRVRIEGPTLKPDSDDGAARRRFDSPTHPH